MLCGVLFLCTHSARIASIHFVFAAWFFRYVLSPMLVVSSFSHCIWLKWCVSFFFIFFCLTAYYYLDVGSTHAYIDYGLECWMGCVLYSYELYMQESNELFVLLSFYFFRSLLSFVEAPFLAHFLPTSIFIGLLCCFFPWFFELPRNFSIVHRFISIMISSFVELSSKSNF